MWEDEAERELSTGRANMEHCECTSRSCGGCVGGARRE